MSFCVNRFERNSAFLKNHSAGLDSRHPLDNENFMVVAFVISETIVDIKIP